MSFTASQLLAVTNWLICMAVAWACICRLNSDICKRRLLLRARYTLLLTGALAKLRDMALFRATLDNYRLLPEAALGAPAWVPSRMCSRPSWA